MPDSYVTSVKIVEEKIQLTVQVDAFVDQSGASGYVEISGQATQTTGTFANFYDIQQIPTAPNGDPNDPDDKDHYYIKVTGAPTPLEFSINHDVTVVLRAARVWLTVLESSQKVSPTTGGAAWNIVKGKAKLDGGSWRAGSGQ